METSSSSNPFLESNPNNTYTEKFGIVRSEDSCIGCGTFSFPNGDTYSGFFKADKNKKIAREGIGVYTTSDGHSYDGPWERDLLDGEDAILNYPGGSFYKGTIKNMKYEGNGSYTFPDGTYLQAKFYNNKPIEGKESPFHIRFDDITGRKWVGKFNNNNIIMLPVHHFIPKEWRIPLEQFPALTESSLLEVPLKTSKPKFSLHIEQEKRTEGSA